MSTLREPFTYLTIQAESTKGDDLKLSFLIDDDGKPDMPSFTFKYKGELECWDSERFLEDLHYTCDCEINSKQTHPFHLVIREIIDYGLYEDMKVILDMFERAVKLEVWERSVIH